jgi:hypothetical protein
LAGTGLDARRPRRKEVGKLGARTLEAGGRSVGNIVRGSREICLRRIQAAEVDMSSAIAESIAQDKDLTKHALGDLVPLLDGIRPA